jgi:NAD(P)-dependent dehydrogenase (short-subunit alcohol dehydrogenase family)
MSYLERLKLTGKTAVIVGASPEGMGGATALALAEAGAKVVNIDIDEEAVLKISEEVKTRGGEALGLTADAMDAESIGDAVATAIDRFGPIDCLVNVVGGTRPQTWRRMEDVSDDLLRSTFDFNTGALFRNTRIVVKTMLESGTDGRIVHFASLSGLTSAPYHGAYGAAKAAVMSLTRTMAVEWGVRGIRVNAVAPASVVTAHTQSMARLGWEGNPPWPLHRFIEKAEVASTVLFLLSDLAGAITGQTLNVDSGASARSPVGDPELFEPRIWTEEDS